MLRITEVQGAAGDLTLRLEGRLSGPWVGELRRIAHEALAGAAPLTLDLAQVAFVDPEGLALLRELAGRAARLVNRSPFLSEQFKETDDGDSADLDRIRRADAASRHDPR